MSNDKMETGSSPAFQANQHAGQRDGELHSIFTPGLWPSDVNAKK
jgi:hypothetical protein